MRVDVGQSEIGALEQQGFAGRLGEHVGKTVAEVQARLVAALAEVEEGLAGEFAVLEGHRLDDDAGAAEKGLGLAHAVRAELALDHHRELDVVGDADPADVGVVDPFDEGLRLRLAVEDRDESGRVDDHFGRPRSS